MINRRKRKRANDPDSLIGAWDRGDPPPAWAFDPGEHYEVLLDLYFFGTDAVPNTREHPRRSEWTEAMRAAKP